MTTEIFGNMLSYLIKPEINGRERTAVQFNMVTFGEPLRSCIHSEYNYLIKPELYLVVNYRDSCLLSCKSGF